MGKSKLERFHTKGTLAQEIIKGSKKVHRQLTSHKVKWGKGV